MLKEKILKEELENIDKSLLTCKKSSEVLLLRKRADVNNKLINIYQERIKKYEMK